MENVRAIVGSGRLQPANAWYGPMTYLPQTAVIAGLERFHRASGGRGWEMLDQNGGATVAAYRVARLVGIAYGVTAVLVLFWAGQALGGAGAGLAAAVVLASSPWAIRSAVEFKPDGPLLLALALCLRALVAACQRPSVGRLIGVAALFGAATAVKLNAAFFAPLLLFPAWALADHPAPAGRGGPPPAPSWPAHVSAHPWFEEWLFFFGRIQTLPAQRGRDGSGGPRRRDGAAAALPVYLGPGRPLCPSAALGFSAPGAPPAGISRSSPWSWRSLPLVAPRRDPLPEEQQPAPLLPFAAVLARLTRRGWRRCHGQSDAGRRWLPCWPRARGDGDARRLSFSVGSTSHRVSPFTVKPPAVRQPAGWSLLRSRQVSRAARDERYERRFVFLVAGGWRGGGDGSRRSLLPLRAPAGARARSAGRSGATDRTDRSLRLLRARGPELSRKCSLAATAMRSGSVPAGPGAGDCSCPELAGGRAGVAPARTPTGSSRRCAGRMVPPPDRSGGGLEGRGGAGRHHGPFSRRRRRRDRARGASGVVVRRSRGGAGASAREPMAVAGGNGYR